MNEKNTQTKQLGVIGAAAGVLGAMQALGVLKYLLGLPINNECLAVSLIGICFHAFDTIGRSAYRHLEYCSP